MVTDPTACTLYDDWKARRERLARATSGVAGHEAVEMRLLDYLLRRYHASPEVARPARFPLPSSMFVNHRTIIVHHHLDQDNPPITNEQDALAHVQPIVHRIQRLQSLSASDEIAISDEGVASCATPPLPDPLEDARTKLCDRDPVVRIQAALQLGEIGNLDDIGLLSDLLSLPTCADEHPRERDSLLHAMQRLSGTTKERFDLSGVLPVPKAPVIRRLREPDTMRGNKPRADYYFYLLLIVLSAALFIFGCTVLILTWMDL